ncbi:hypothetical protein [Microbulbifer sp.]|uniref:hypothetical protein n=1 Tax=Microbulbifer sp. TaxID=1908541 RepID=UPI002584DAD1|nr:hypothetical protein [Microbulbifer sp.]
MELKLCSKRGNFQRHGKGRRWWPFLFLALANLPLQSVAQEASAIGLEFSSRTLSEPLPIKTFTDEWDRVPGDGEATWTRNRIGISANYGSWSIGYRQRFDYSLRYNKSTADLYYRDENNLPAIQGEVPVYLEINQLLAHGLTLGYRKQWSSGFFVGATAAWLQASDFQAGELRGALNGESDLFAGTAALDYRYSEDLLLDHQFERPHGKGVTLDLALGYVTNARRFSIQVQDLYSRVDWEQAPHTAGSFDSVDRDVEDKVQLNPLFSGTRQLEQFSQTLPLYGTARYIEYTDGADWVLDLEYFDGALRYRPGLQWGSAPGNPYLGYEPERGEWQLQLRNESGSWHLTLGTDDLDLEEAHSLTIAMGWGRFW